MAAEVGDETSSAYYLEAWRPSPVSTITRRPACLLAAARSQLEASGSGWPHALPATRPPHTIPPGRAPHPHSDAHQQAQAWGASSAEADGPENTHWDRTTPAS